MTEKNGAPFSIAASIISDMNPYDKAKELELKAKRKREREAEENRRKFKVLNDPFISELCSNFGGRVIYVENNQGEWKGRKR